MNFLEVLKAIYNKTYINEEPDMQLNIGLNNCLIRDIDYAYKLKKIINYIFYIEPKHYYYLLFLNLSQKSMNLIKFKKTEQKEDKLLQKIKYVLQWSDRELNFNKKILQSLDKKYWEKKLAI